VQNNSTSCSLGKNWRMVEGKPEEKNKRCEKYKVGETNQRIPKAAPQVGKRPPNRKRPRSRIITREVIEPEGKEIKDQEKGGRRASSTMGKRIGRGIRNRKKEIPLGRSW